MPFLPGQDAEVAEAPRPWRIRPKVLVFLLAMCAAAALGDEGLTAVPWAKRCFGTVPAFDDMETALHGIPVDASSKLALPNIASEFLSKISLERSYIHTYTLYAYFIDNNSRKNPGKPTFYPKLQGKLVGIPGFFPGFVSKITVTGFMAKSTSRFERTCRSTGRRLQFCCS